jgi:hypothetical protein
MGNLYNSDNFFSVAVCEYSDIIDGTGQPWFNEGCIDADPLFEDTSQNNYHLLSNSPCIDTGDPESPLDPDGTIADIGALYFDQATNLEETIELPEYSILLDNYPNPFNARTTVRFFLPISRDIELVIYDLLGRRIEVLIDEYREAGVHGITFDASSLSSGVYFYSLRAGDVIESKRMVLLK